MIVSATSSKQDPFYFSQDPYDPVVIADFFYNIQLLWSRQGVDGGNTDRLDVAVEQGRNSAHFYLERDEWSFTGYKFVVNAENEAGAEYTDRIPLPPLPSEFPNKLDRLATISWCESALTSLNTCKHTLGLPFFIPPWVVSPESQRDYDERQAEIEEETARQKQDHKMFEADQRQNDDGTVFGIEIPSTDDGTGHRGSGIGSDWRTDTGSGTGSGTGNAVWDVDIDYRQHDGDEPRCHDQQETPPLDVDRLVPNTPEWARKHVVKSSEYTMRLDNVSDTLFYMGEAKPGSLDTSPVWKISKNVMSVDGSISITWADGNARLDNIWNDHLLLTYL